MLTVKIIRQFCKFPPFFFVGSVNVERKSMLNSNYMVIVTLLYNQTCLKQDGIEMSLKANGCLIQLILLLKSTFGVTKILAFKVRRLLNTGDAYQRSDCTWTDHLLCKQLTASHRPQQQQDWYCSLFCTINT